MTSIVEVNWLIELVIAATNAEWGGEVDVRPQPACSAENDLPVVGGHIDPSAYIQELQGALQMVADALRVALAGHPVTNAPHCFAAAERLLEGTEFEFHH